MNTVLRNIYAINFGVLFFTMLTSYLVTKPEISGFGFSNTKFPLYDPIIKSTHLLVLPTAYIITGKKSLSINFLTNSVIPLLYIHFASLLLQFISVIICKNFILYLISIGITNYIYSSLDFVLDQLNSKLLVRENNQAYRGKGAVLASILAIYISYFKGTGSFSVGLIIIIFVIFNQIDNTKKNLSKNMFQIKPNKKNNKSGYVTLNTFLLVISTVFITSVSDGIMDASAKVILQNTKSRSPIIIRYISLVFGYLISTPGYINFIPKIGMRYFATMIMIFRIWVLYKFDEYSGTFGLTYAFAFQSIADISSGTIFKNDIENDNRDCLLNSKLENIKNYKYVIPGWMANFIAEQFSPILKTFLSFAFYSMSMKNSFNREFWMIVGGITIILSTIITTIIQNYNKNHEKIM